MQKDIDELLAKTAKLPKEYHMIEYCSETEYESVIGKDTHTTVIYKRNDLINSAYPKRFVYDVLSTISDKDELEKEIAICLKMNTVNYDEYKHQIMKYLPKLPSFYNSLWYHTYEPIHVNGFEDGTIMRYTIIKPYED